MARKLHRITSVSCTPNLDFLHTSVNNWKKVQQKKMHNKKGRPNLISDDLLGKVKDIMVCMCAAGGVISRQIVIAEG